MKRFHISVTVADLDKSIGFYQTLFGAEPTVKKEDYAKWMLEDPRLNFSIKQSLNSHGINHIGLQADSMDELAQIQQRLEEAGEQTLDQGHAECCYAKSSKTWVRDPDNITWETFVTHGQITHYGSDFAPLNEKVEAEESRCCA